MIARILTWTMIIVGAALVVAGRWQTRHLGEVDALNAGFSWYAGGSIFLVVALICLANQR